MDDYTKEPAMICDVCGNTIFHRAEVEETYHVGDKLVVVEGIPAVALGAVTLGYLTDRPSEARWLGPRECQWISEQIAVELDAKRRLRQHTILEAFGDRRVILLAASYLMVISGALANIYWLPTFIKRISGLSTAPVTSLAMIPAAIGVIGTLCNGWHSDRSAERRWHAAVPLLTAGVLYACVALFSQEAAPALALLLLGAGVLYCFYPPFWALPTLILSDAAAAASFALIVSIAQLAGPYIIGWLNDRTHSLAAGFAFIAAAYLVGGGLILKLASPVGTSARAKARQCARPIGD